MRNRTRLFILLPLLAGLFGLAGCARDEPYLVIYGMDRVDDRLGDVEVRYQEQNTADDLDELTRKVASDTAEVEGKYKGLQSDVRSIQQNLEWLEAKYDGKEPSNSNTGGVVSATEAVNPGATPVPTPASAIVAEETENELPALRVVPTIPPAEELARMAVEDATEEVTPLPGEVDEWTEAPPDVQAPPEVETATAEPTEAAPVPTAESPTPLPTAEPSPEPTEEPTPIPTEEPTPAPTLDLDEGPSGYNVSRGAKDASVDLTRNDQAVFEEALRLHGQGGCARSSPAFQEFLDEFPGSEQADVARLVLAQCLMRENRYHAALIHVRGNTPENWDAETGPRTLLFHGECLANTGRESEAAEKYRELVETFPESDEAATARERLGE